MCIRDSQPRSSRSSTPGRIARRSRRRLPVLSLSGGGVAAAGCGVRTELAYTSDVDFDAVLADGSLAHIRPPVDGDRAALLALHEGLSERSAYFRYFSLSRQAGAAHVDHLLAAPAWRD